ncbi:hypothetical protein COCNU_02G012740 [Cocos nucifera]|uniref:Uncharacterized protein n=1 Tax=Cocos nucifera TaxID=13894 RepID=A0A8K0HZQ8_COCNU|nr:hypothetical protein COCNU_02G012740 [Cocos nucifera]
MAEGGVTAVVVEGMEEDEVLSDAGALSRDEVLRRRLRRVRQLQSLYRRQYWALVEEVRVRHRDYYWELGIGWFLLIVSLYVLEDYKYFVIQPFIQDLPDINLTYQTELDIWVDPLPGKKTHLSEKGFPSLSCFILELEIVVFNIVILQSSYCENVEQPEGFGNSCPLKDHNEKALFCNSGKFEFEMSSVHLFTILMGKASEEKNGQWEALALLLIGISVNQLRSLPEGATALGLPVATVAYIYTVVFVTVPSLASVYNEYALKSQFETSIYLQNLFLYGYGAIFNFLAILGTAIFKGVMPCFVLSKGLLVLASIQIVLKQTLLHSLTCCLLVLYVYGKRSFVFAEQILNSSLVGPGSFDILQGHSKATMLLICNNAAQGILSSFFFKYAGNRVVSVFRSKEASFINMTAGAAEDASHHVGPNDREPLLPK